MADPTNQTGLARQEAQRSSSSTAGTGQDAVIPERARQALTERKAAIKDARAGLAKEFGTVTRDIMAALQKSAQGAAQTASAYRIAESMRKEGPVVETNTTGLVARVVYPDGTSRQFQYGEDGKLSQLTDKDGTTWRLRDNIWIQFAADGSVSGEIWEGTISIDETGIYHYEDPADASHVYERPDGSKLVEDSDGLRMEADEHGQMVCIEYADATSRKFQYSADGSLNRVIEPDGSTWKTSDGLRWFHYGADGDKTGTVWFGKMSVDRNGSYVKEDAGTGEKIIEEPYGGRISEGADGKRLIQNPDGTVLVETPDGTRLYTTADGTHISETPSGFKARKPDGAEIEADHARRIIKVIYPDMTLRNFKYDQHDALVQMWDRDGTIWKKGSGSSWTQYKADGRPTGQVRAGDISVDQHGNCIYLDSQNSAAWIEQPDGLRVTQSAEGARIETSADGRSATYVAPGGRRFAVSTEGFLKYETRPGDRLGSIALDAIIYRHFFEPGYTPTKDEVAQEKRRLSRITNVEDVRELPVGKTIMIKTRVETMTREVMREIRQISRSMAAASAETAAESPQSDLPVATTEPSETGAPRRVPRDTAEMLLPWFSPPDLEFFDEPESAPNAPPVDPSEFDLDSRDTTPVEQQQKEEPAAQDALAIAPEELSSPPSEKTPPRRMDPWSSKPSLPRAQPAVEPPAQAPVPPAETTSTGSEPSPTSPPKRRIAPWSSKPSLPRAERIAEANGQANEVPEASSTPSPVGPAARRTTPRSTIPPTATPTAAKPTAEFAPPRQTRIKIEMDGQGRVLKVDYPDETYKVFEYDPNGQLVQLLHNDGRTTRRNGDSTWTTSASDGSPTHTSDPASVVVEQDGSIIWESHADGSASVQRADGSTVFMDGSGDLLRFVSSAGRIFSSSQHGVLVHESDRESTLQDIAEDALKAWCWQHSIYVPAQRRRDEMVSLLASVNNLDEESTVVEGDVLIVPPLAGIGFPQLNALQRSMFRSHYKANESD